MDGAAVARPRGEPRRALRRQARRPTRRPRAGARRGRGADRAQPHAGRCGADRRGPAPRRGRPARRRPRQYRSRRVRRARGIEVIPATGANALAVAEYVIAAAMLLLRGVVGATAAVGRGDWPRARLSQGRELAGKTLGIVGFGSIGRRLAARLGAAGRHGSRRLRSAARRLDRPLGRGACRRLHAGRFAARRPMSCRCTCRSRRPRGTCSTRRASRG